MKRLILLFLTVFIFIFPIISQELTFDELYIATQQIETKIKDYKELNYDEKVQSIIFEIKSIALDYKKKGQNITVLDRTLLTKINELDERIKKLRFFNVDDELLVLIKYLNTRLKKFEDTTKTTTEITIKDTDKMIIEFLIQKNKELEERIDRLSPTDTADLEKLKKEIEEKIKKIEELEKSLNVLLSDKDLTDKLKKIDSKDTQKITDLKKIVDDIINEREQQKKIILSQIHESQYGKEFSFQFSLSLTGIMTSVYLGILTPKIKNLCAMGAFFNFHISIPGTYVAENYRTASITGSYFLAFFTPMFINYMRIYFGLEAHAGSIFSITNTSLFSKNLTVGGYLFAGIEFYLIKQIAFFIEAGGGIMHTFSFAYPDVSFVADILTLSSEEKAVRDNNNNGTGIKLNFGMRVYLAKGDKRASKKSIIESDIFKINK